MPIREILRKARRAAFEMVGSDHYSRPAANDLDRKLSRYLTQRGGFFVEAGANDGFTQSNTYYLEKFRGWRGLLVEAIPDLHQQAQRNRSRSIVENCALVPFHREGEMIELTYGNLMSVVSGAMGSEEADAEHIRKARNHDAAAGSYRISVRGRSLSSLLDKHGVAQIDFLSLDVEGFEAAVLGGVDFARHRPKFICIEARDKPEIERVLSPHYDMVEQLSAMDVLYALRA